MLSKVCRGKENNNNKNEKHNFPELIGLSTTGFKTFGNTFEKKGGLTWKEESLSSQPLPNPAQLLPQTKSYHLKQKKLLLSFSKW